MADIFEHINELNIKMQVKYENNLTCTDKFNGFNENIMLWQNQLRRGSLVIFPRSNQNQGKIDKGFVLDLVQKHLWVLHQKYHY